MYVYDIVLNFSDTNNGFDFFEWKKEDTFSYIDKILLFKVDDKCIKDINNYKIRVNANFLKAIEDTASTNGSSIKYCCLFGSDNCVLALEFSSDGVAIKKSSMLLDEEDEVIEEIKDLKKYDFKYELAESINNMYFLTRDERLIRQYLLDEIDNLYSCNNYDEISYLYFEIFNDSNSIDIMYKELIEGITNSFNDDYARLYKIVSNI